MNREDYYFLNEDSRTFLSRGYLSEGKTPEERYEEIAKTAENILGFDGFAEKFLGYLKRGYFSLATPVITNFGNERGLPVSCFSSFIPDTMDGILDKVAEVGMMTKYGGGTSGYFGDLRPRGATINGNGESSGPVHFMQLFDKTSQIVTQGSSRRGAFAAYLPVEHPDILEFLQIRANEHPIQDMSFGVTITDEWMKSMISGDADKRAVWAKIIRKRFETGYPYIIFIDNANNKNPQVYKDKGLSVKSSNLCSEIMLHSDEDNSFVCVLSSINLLHWDEISKTDAVETLIYFLDAVNEEFVTKTEGDKHMFAPHNFAKNHRALGLGVLGWHSYLQSKNIAFESMQAKLENASIFKTLSERCNNATQYLAQVLGETPLTEGYGVRNTHTMAIAPTTSSSFILGQVSPSIEPLNSNYFVKKLAKGNFSYRNPYLEELLSNYDKNDADTWKSILVKGGSVQHLSFLTQHEKDVFKTFAEISQKEVIIQAAQRQSFIDQGQSLNLMVPASSSPKEVSQLMIFAWEQGIKGLYYQRSSNPSQDLSRSLLECKSCEG